MLARSRDLTYRHEGGRNRKLYLIISCRLSQTAQQSELPKAVAVSNQGDCLRIQLTAVIKRATVISM